jgi:protein-S-isoprenylcysteine O-methyltransferase Ste14
MKNLELRIPPPFVALVTGALMLLVALGKFWAFVFPGQWIVAAGIGLLGSAVIILNIISFFRAQTTWSPLTPEKTTTLVVNGMYRYSRNPIYLGFLFLVIGWGFYGCVKLLWVL